FDKKGGGSQTGCGIYKLEIMNGGEGEVGKWGGGEVGARAFVRLFSTGSLNAVQLRRRTTNLQNLS
ncbi:hypothetical protein, partial [Microcystis aeruginosa]|uniref:hypothetical protein n=1 Tax=Microcystis aeruginosa TaxID=1126 RepID=UPI001C99768E